jgi:hypothetical protein
METRLGEVLPGQGSYPDGAMAPYRACRLGCEEAFAKIRSRCSQ